MLGSERLEPFGYLIGEAMFQLNRSPIEVAEILQALLERAQIWRFFFGVSRVPQNADSRDSIALLRPYRKRPRKIRDASCEPPTINNWAKAAL